MVVRFALPVSFDVLLSTVESDRLARLCQRRGVSSADALAQLLLEDALDREHSRDLTREMQGLALV